MNIRRGKQAPYTLGLMSHRVLPWHYAQQVAPAPRLALGPLSKGSAGT